MWKQVDFEIMYAQKQHLVLPELLNFAIIFETSVYCDELNVSSVYCFNHVDIVNALDLQATKRYGTMNSRSHGPPGP